MKNISYYFSNFSDTKKTLQKSVEEELHISNVGLISYFDSYGSCHYSNEKKHGFYTKFKLFHNNDPIFENIKVNIKEIENFSHLIWLENEVCIGSEEQFVWNYTHELQHLVHSLRYPYTSVVSDFITEVRIRTQKVDLHTLDRPDEFDCEKVAFEITALLKSKKAAVDYFSSLPEIYKEKFILAEKAFTGNVFENLLGLLEQYYTELKKCEKKLSDENKFTFDVDKSISDLKIICHKF